MITLIVLAYVFISLIFSLNNMRDRLTLLGDTIKGQKPKEAFIEGFLILPILALIGGIFIGLIYVLAWMAGGILEGLFWIYSNMP